MKHKNTGHTICDLQYREKYAEAEGVLIVILSEIAKRISARILTGNLSCVVDISRFFASNSLSEMLNYSSKQTLVITALTGSQVLRMAELMDVPGICFAKGAAPHPEVVEAARELGVVLMVSELDTCEIYDVLKNCLKNEAGLRQ